MYFLCNLDGKTLGKSIPFFEGIHCGLDMLPVLVAVPYNHLQGLVTGNALNGWQVFPGLYKMGNGRVAQGAGSSPSSSDP